MGEQEPDSSFTEIGTSVTAPRQKPKDEGGGCYGPGCSFTVDS